MKFWISRSLTEILLKDSFAGPGSVQSSNVSFFVSSAGSTSFAGSISFAGSASLGDFMSFVGSVFNSGFGISHSFAQRDSSRCQNHRRRVRARRDS